MNYEQIKESITAAQKLLDESATSKEKVESLQKLLKGIDPTLDRALSDLTKVWAKIGKLQKGEIIELSSEAIPEDTEEDRKRKKAIILFIKSWKELKGEVARVEKELNTSQGKIQRAGKIAGLAKGPFGIITAIAVVIVVGGILLKSNAKIIKVIEVNGKKVPVSQFIIGTGADCDSPHYHAPNEGTVTALDGTKLQDPGGCGFGKVKDTAVYEYRR